MKTTKLFKLFATFCMMFLVSMSYGQDVGGIIKRKVKKRAKKKIEKTVDQGLDVIEGKDPNVIGDGPYGEVVVVSRDATGKNVPIANFIDPGTAIFVDDFNTERPAEYPSKWTQIKGSLETNQIIVGGEKDGVIQTISGSTDLKPSIKGDNYLGNSFKVEMQVYFHEKGNEAYYVNLKNSNVVHGSHSIRISGGIMWSGSDNLSRMPGGNPQPGWHTLQISFNNGHLKGYLDGVMLVNDPDISRPGVEKKSFTHLEVNILSPSITSTPPLKQMVTYFAIGGKGHTLYNRLINEGRLIMHNINFEVNSYTLTPSSYAVLDQLVTMLTEHSEVTLGIHGHTDSDGSNSFNQTLSENRARSVMEYLTRKGVKASRLTSTGYGEEKPIAMGSTEEAKAKNRRVEFVLKQ